MKRYVRMPHSKKLRELIRLQRKTNRTAVEDARHEHLYYWLQDRSDRSATDAQDIVADSERNYRLMTPKAVRRAILRELKRAKWSSSASYEQALGRTKRTVVALEFGRNAEACF